MLGTLTTSLGDSTTIDFFQKQLRRGPRPLGGPAEQGLIGSWLHVAIPLECGPGVALLIELSLSSMSYGATPCRSIFSKKAIWLRFTNFSRKTKQSIEILSKFAESAMLKGIVITKLCRFSKH